jgi:hypothetical protein
MYTQALRLVADSTYASWIAQLNSAGSEAHEFMLQQFGRPCQMQIRRRCVCRRGKSDAELFGRSNYQWALRRRAGVLPNKERPDSL